MTAVFGIKFSDKTQSELIAVMTQQRILRGTGPRTLVTANLDHIATLTDDMEFRSAYRNAWQVTADGMPVFAYAKLRGSPSPGRVPGSDLVAALLPALPPEGTRVLFISSTWQTGRRLQAYLVSRGFRRSQVAFVVPEFGFERDQSASLELADRIRAHGTTHLFVGVGAPKSEKWVDRYRSRIGDCYVLCIGASLEFFAQTKRRAPVWMRRCGLEWSWRLGQEPGRLWRRYIVNSWRFLSAVGDDLTTTRRWAIRL